MAGKPAVAIIPTNNHDPNLCYFFRLAEQDANNGDDVHQNNGGIGHTIMHDRIY
jgi:hypothetical protein